MKRIRTKRLLLALAIASAPAIGNAQTLAVPPNFVPVGFLLGSWSGAGTADVGAGSGSDTFALDVENNVLLRRSHAVYPGKDGKPGVTYDALMVIYKDPAYPNLRADYFDNGSHVIHYSLVPGAGAHVAQFVSDASPATPTFRLTYTDGADDKTMTVTFELAAPGSKVFSTTIARGTDVRASRT